MYHPPSMRKTGPILILIIGIAALIIDFVPGLRLPDSASVDGSRTLETKLGLDLRGGLRVEYLAKQVGDKIPRPEDLEVIRDIIERRVNATGVSEPVITTQGTTGSSSSSRASPTRTPSADSSARPGASISFPSAPSRSRQATSSTWRSFRRSSAGRSWPARPSGRTARRAAES